MLGKEHSFEVLDSFLAQIAIVDSNGTIVHVNDSWKEATRDDGADELPAHKVGENYLAICSTAMEAEAAGASDILLGIQRVLRRELDTFAFEYPCHSPTTDLWFWTRVTPHKHFPGHAVVAHFDITERKQTEQEVTAAHDELHTEKLRAEVTLRSIGDAVITTDTLGYVEFINPIAEQLTGWKLENAVGQRIETVFHILNENDRTPAESPVMQCIAQGTLVGRGNHTILVGRHGKEYFIQDSAAPIWNPQHQLLGTVLVFSDASERYQLAREAIYDASHDALTGLVNRREFELRLKRVLLATHLENNVHTLAFLDLDHFKVINDTSGHSAGDELLRQLSRLLQTQIRRRDTFARLGGDEFGLLMEHCSLAQAQRIVEKLRQSISDLSFMWEGRSFHIGASVGLVIVDSSSGNITELLRRADAACYAAKDEGRNRIHIYRDNDVDLAARDQKVKWVERIEEALDENRFRLYCQPLVELATPASHRDDVHCELLLRLENERGELILPGAFLPAAERYKLAVKLDRWVVSHALSQLARSPPLIARLIHCGINLTAQSLAEPSMAEFIELEFEKSGIPPNKICFEVTEKAVMADLGAATELFERLHAIGCTFALDDFGTGLSSLTHLKTLPVDYLKIDGAFVMDMVDNRIDYAMVKSINEIGHVMGKITVAEFAESDAIVNKLRELGVDYAQGYTVGHPAPLEDLLSSVA